ncbi:MAG: hypothetical protein P3W93_005270 [Thermus sp.]|nr:hypothetical protein [Thermus sp.]
MEDLGPKTGNTPLRKGKTFWVFRLSLLLERLRPRLYPKPPPALVQEHPRIRTSLRLDLSYYPARSKEEYILIPWDKYMEEGEKILKSL